MIPDPTEQLAALLRETGAAHEQAFGATNGEDAEWPTWYARYLAPRLQRELGGQVDQAALAADLRQVDGVYRASDGREPWPEFYARWFVGRRRQ